jgi:hypothetical protein
LVKKRLKMAADRQRNIRLQDVAAHVDLKVGRDWSEGSLTLDPPAFPPIGLLNRGGTVRTEEPSANPESPGCGQDVFNVELEIRD